MAKVLIVIDGVFRFITDADPADHDFTFTALVAALSAAGHQVTKAHRQTDAGADHANFKFYATLNLLDFDVIWLIGHDGRNDTMPGAGTPISDTEIKALAQFMAAGGGVFATGDHDSIGSEMSGRIPRVRAMRSWYGAMDPTSPMPANFPVNFPLFTAGRADTTQRNPASDYGGDPTFAWFQNQSDAVPQPITPIASPAHPILRRNGADIVIYPDHMHEGNTLGEVMTYDYTQSLTFSGEKFAEFPIVSGNREMPQVIATGQTTVLASKDAQDGGGFLDNAASAAKTVNSLAVYDGRTVGVGRIVTGSTFHHYIDINLTGDSTINTASEIARTSSQSEKTHGLNDAPSHLADIKAVYENITEWLARPRPAIQLVLERSTFSETEATANPDFPGCFLVIVDGLKPSQFPGGGVTTLSPSSAQLASWAPILTPDIPKGLTITPTAVASDDPLLSDRLQRLTFTYSINLKHSAFSFGGTFENIRIDAALNSAAVSTTLTDTAWMQLVKTANPFMLDLANNNTTAWLSSDVRIFPVVTGTTFMGQALPLNASRSQALSFLHNLMGSMSIAQFEGLSMDEVSSALSPFATTTGSPSKRVYNFAVARVRVPSSGPAADDVRVFFRIFPSPTTAALTYFESPPGTPIQGYKRTPLPNPIALPGTNAAGTEWISFPMFSASRVTPPENQTDGDNDKMSLPAGSSTLFGALVDNNLTDPYLPPTPMGGGAVDLPTLMMGEHQCIVAQIEFSGTPIPSGANPATSDKLSQRNIAFSPIANPGLDASRMALHTFEIEATPHAIGVGQPPDELLLDWRNAPPDGTEVRIYMPGWNARDIIDLADRFYARHEIRMLDDHTVAVPGGGTRYVPIPQGTMRRTGVISAQFPLGVVKGERFDLAVRQITTRSRIVEAPVKATTITRAEAARLLAGKGPEVRAKKRGSKAQAAELPLGVFDLGGNKVLVTDMTALSGAGAGDQAVIVEHPSAQQVAKARRESAAWRETIGAFQLGIPVSAKSDMLPYFLRLLSALTWRAEKLRRDSGWYQTFLRYLELIAEKVRALGGDPWSVPATPDGNIDLPGEQPGGEAPGLPDAGGPGDPYFEPGGDNWLGNTDGLDAPDHTRAGICSGKISGLLFDHFGGFEGFTLESYAGSEQRFFSQEVAILEIARNAWLERYVVTVITVSAHSRRVRRLLIRGYAD